MKLLVIPISNPILVGLYDNQNKLVKIIEKEGKTSDILPQIFEEVLEENNITNIYYVNGPGSYMAIKVAYMFLKTISITKNIKLKASDGFNFNNFSPIKALGKKYFFKAQDGNIMIDFLKEEDIIEDFRLPKNLDEDIFLNETLPNYNLPAIN